MVDFADFDIVIPSRQRGSKGNIKVVCPKCKSAGRSLSVHLEKGIWYCHRDGWKGSLHADEGYTIPDTDKISKNLSKEAMSWLLARKLSVTAIGRSKITSSVLFNDKFNFKYERLEYPLIRHNKITNVAYRRFRVVEGTEPKKLNRFYFETGCQLSLCNIDCLDDLNVEVLFWFEGWLDGLAFETALNCMRSAAQYRSIGWVAIPNGSPKEGTVNFDGRLKVIDIDYDRISKIKTHVMFLDNDGPGRAMTRALVRRLDQKKCQIVKWPEQDWIENDEKIKDCGDILRVLGVEKLIDFAGNFEPYPLDGVYTKRDFIEVMTNPKEAKPDAYIGIPEFDEMFGYVFGYCHVITGPPNEGKSTKTLDDTRRMVQAYDFGATLFCAENMISSVGRILLSQFSGFHHSRLTDTELKQWAELIAEKIQVIKTDEITDLETILSIGEGLVHQKGNRILVIDPYTKIRTTENESGLSELQLLNNRLNRCSDYAKKTDSILIIVAHPSVVMNKDGSTGTLHSAYKINGGSPWFNLVDMCYATNPPDDREELEFGFLPARFDILKVREKPEFGKLGRVDLYFNEYNKRYYGKEEMLKSISLLEGKSYD